MRRATEFDDCCAAFAESYELSRLPAMRAIERSVLGCDYGGTSWTTRAEADEIIGALGLHPGVRLLEIGAGSGWPGLFVAEASGCDVTLLDLPVNALAMAVERAAADGIADRVSAIAASGTSLPFLDGIFDAASHSDVLCCLPDKQDLLAECRRVVAAGARMLFSVILIPPDVPPAGRHAAIETGPPFVASSRPYPDLLADSGWTLERVTDVTAAYLESLHRHVRGFRESTALAAALGGAAVAEAVRRRERQIAAIRQGSLVRQVFLAHAA